MSEKKELKDIDFSVTQKRLIRTIQVKHNQAMTAEINTALLEIFKEIGFDTETDKDYQLKTDYMGLEVIKKSEDKK